VVKVSVTLGSSRPGGVDISLRGLADQTYDDFEIIFVDGRYHRRHEEVLDCVKKLGIKQPFYHVPNHRYNGFWSTPCAGYNTGFMLAEGEIVIMLLDYAYAPPGWIENHLKFHNKKRLVMAPHFYTEMPEVVTKDGKQPIQFTGGSETTVENILKQKENFDELSIFKYWFESSWLKSLKIFEWPHQDPKSIFPTGPLGYDYMHTKNDSFPLKVALDIGGMDENYDRGRGPGDTEFGYRLFIAGCEPWLSQEAKVYCLNPRGIMPNLNLTIPLNWSEPQPRWSYAEGTAYLRTRQNEIANGQPPKAKNPYDTYERRKEIWHWRDLSQEKEALIPLNNVPDEQWFK
jgi:hypothetical protein